MDYILMKNFEFSYKGQKYWYSRGIVCAVFLFATDKDDNIYVLANKRGSGVSNTDEWNCPCGHLDFDESCEQCAVRETYEETGIKIDESILRLYDINSKDFESKDQSVGFIYSGFLFGTYIEDMPTSTKNMEVNEVKEVKWINVDDIDEYDWAFNHNERIKQILLKYIHNNEI